ncbi:hypothetical protein ACTHGU_16960 [Chitinophagaceae bacterium MMS25-I14]
MKKYLFLICFFFAVLLPSVKGQEKDSIALAVNNYKLQDRGKVQIHRIWVQGTNRTRRQILLREMSVQEGDTIEAAAIPQLLEQNKLRLYNISLFTDINMHVTAVSDTSVDWYIIAKERWYIWPELSFQLADRNFNVWWKEQHRDLHRANIGISAADHNFRGNLESLGAGVQLGYTQKFSLDYFRPYVDKKQKHGFGFSFSVAHSQEMAYNTDSNKLLFAKDRDRFIFRQIDAAVIYTIRPGYASRHLFQLSYNDDQVADTIARLNPEYYANGSRNMRSIAFSYRYDLNHVDNWNYPLRGSKLVSYTSLITGLEGMKFQAYSTLEAAFFRNPWPKWFVSYVFRGRLTLPYDQPYSFRTALGTRTDYVRGYEYYVIDGSQYGLFRFNFKRELINKTFKKLPFRYLPTFPVRIYPKILADIGYVANRYPGNSFLNNRLLYSYGVGLDIVTAYDFKLRIEYVWNHLGQNGLFLHFNSE